MVYNQVAHRQLSSTTDNRVEQGMSAFIDGYPVRLRRVQSVVNSGLLEGVEVGNVEACLGL
jgi:hypothetical protein